MTAMADGNVIEIWTVAQLKALRDNVNLQSGNDTYAGKTVKLMTDLTISDNTWVPIGLDNDTHSFQGTFDGQGYIITINVTKSSLVLGLFGYVGSSGVVQNLRVAGRIANTETGPTTYTGGIAGKNHGTIRQCANLANITGRYDVGGIAGENRGTITNCYNQGYIGGTGSETTSKFLGGIVGDNQSPGTITYCYAKCDIEDEGTKEGIVANNNGTVSNCSFDVTLYNTSNKLTGSTTLTGNALKSYLDNSIWTFTDGQLPELNSLKSYYTVQFYKNDNNITGAMLDQYFTVGVTKPLSNNTFDGKIFTGWATEANGNVVYANQESVTNLTGANTTKTLYAKWTDTYTVIFNKNAEDATGTMADQSLTYGENTQLTQLTPNAFTRTGYTFAGWNTLAAPTDESPGTPYVDQQFVQNITDVNHGTITLYAQWTPHTYTVKFNANGGSGTMSDMSFTYGEAQNLTANAFTPPTGKIFVGWSKTQNGNVEYTDGQYVKNLTNTPGAEVTLYALWKREITITAKDASKTYDGSALTEGDFTITGLDSGDSHTFTVTMTAASTITNAGTRPNVIATVDGVAVTTGLATVVEDYWVTVEDGTLEVTQKALTITAESDTKVYDGTALTKNSYTNTDLATGDAIESVTVTGSQTVVGTSNNVPSAAVIKNAGNEDVTANYNITYTNGTLEVTQKAVTITADGDTKVYDGTALTKNSYTNTDLATGDAIESVTVTGSQTVVGTSNNVPSAAVIKNGTTDMTANYNITYTNGTLEVTQKALTITAESDTKVYDGTALTKNTYINTALATGDAIESVTVTGSQTVVGSSDNVPSAAVIKNGDTDVTANYNITYTNGTLEVTQKAVTITADGDTKVYDGTALTKSTYTNTALATGDQIESVTVTGSQTVVGTSNNVPSAAVIKHGETDVTASYNITYANGTLEVTQKALTITAESDTKVYDGTPLTKSTYTNTGLASSDAIESVTVTGSQTVVGTNNNVPSAAVIKNGSGENVTASYDITYANGTLTIDPASVTLTANSGTETYDGTHKTVEGFTSSVTGLTFSNVSASGSGTNTGSYDVTFSGVTINTTKDNTGNYVVTGTTNGTLTIDKAVTVDGGLTIEWDENGKVAIFSGSTTDADAVSITTPITDVTAVTLNRDFSNGKYATLILPFTMTNDMTLTGAKLYQFVGVEKKNGQWIATMQTPTSPLQANTPYLVDPVTTDLTGGKLTFNLNGEKVMLQTDDSNNGSTNSNWQFKGTYSRLIYGTAPLTDYVYGFASKDKEVNGVDVKAGEFVYAKEGAAVPPLRCYLTYKNGELFNGARTMTRGEVDEDVPHSIIVRLLGADGEPTNVVSMDIQTGEISTDGWYSMDGVKLQGKPTKKGLYIHNGKKEIVK